MQVLKHHAKVVARDQSHRPMKRVFVETFANVNFEDERQVDHLPTLKAMRNCLYRSRAKLLPSIPHTRAEVELAGEWTQTLDGRDFALPNDNIDDRLLIFGTGKGPETQAVTTSHINKKQHADQLARGRETVPTDGSQRARTIGWENPRVCSQDS